MKRFGSFPLTSHFLPRSTRHTTAERGTTAKKMKSDKTEEPEGAEDSAQYCYCDFDNSYKSSVDYYLLYSSSMVLIASGVEGGSVVPAI